MIKKNWFWYLIIVIFIIAFLKDCDGKKVKTVTVRETVKVTDTFTNTVIQKVPKVVYIERLKTIKKDTIIYKDKADSTTIQANQYTTTLKSNKATAELQITTTGELLNVSGIITFPKVEKTTTITKIKDKSGLYIYGQIPINNIASPEVGVLIQVRNKMFISTGVQYNNLSQQLDYKVGVGIKIW